MKKILIIAAILTAFVFETNAFYESLSGYWYEPFYRTKTISNIWLTSVDWEVAAHGNTAKPNGKNMFSYARLKLYNSPTNIVLNEYVYSDKDSWVEKSGTYNAPSGGYIYKAVFIVSAEMYWTYNPTTKYTAPAEAAIWKW